MLRLLDIIGSDKKENITVIDNFLPNVDIYFDNIKNVSKKEIDIIITNSMISLELLQNSDVKLVCRVVKIENITDEDILIKTLLRQTNGNVPSPVKDFDYDAEGRMINQIQEVEDLEVTLGEALTANDLNVPCSLGSYTSCDRMLDYSAYGTNDCSISVNGIVCGNVLFDESIDLAGDIIKDMNISAVFSQAYCTGGRQHGRI